MQRLHSPCGLVLTCDSNRCFTSFHQVPAFHTCARRGQKSQSPYTCDSHEASSALLLISITIHVADPFVMGGCCVDRAPLATRDLQDSVARHSSFPSIVAWGTASTGRAMSVLDTELLCWNIEHVAAICIPRFSRRSRRDANFQADGLLSSRAVLWLDSECFAHTLSVTKAQSGHRFKKRPDS